VLVWGVAPLKAQVMVVPAAMLRLDGWKVESITATVLLAWAVRTTGPGASVASIIIAMSGTMTKARRRCMSGIPSLYKYRTIVA
jgi:hypothetical protein